MANRQRFSAGPQEFPKLKGGPADYEEEELLANMLQGGLSHGRTAPGFSHID
jgi:hypothetical protein